MRHAPLVAITATLVDYQGAARVRVNHAYVRALEEAGLVPLVIPPLSDTTAALSILDAVSGLVLTGGEDVDPAHFGQAPHATTMFAPPARDATELALAAAAQHRQLPLLAICRGAQVLNVALGGTLVQDIPSQHAGALPHQGTGIRDQRVHAISIERGTRLHAAVGAAALRCNSFHHQAVDSVAPGLVVVATAPDGVVEAIEPADSAWWAVGVQWHPEELTRTDDSWDRQLFAAFATVVHQYRRPAEG
jgi:putative glutamine amidotransferase